ncbi:MAG6410 family transglutaminase-related lipoprotein [Streptococcus ruminantium]|uniref:MAG6410 family transglutaminase-related lipoprotein n=1 Tax=Streptococcus ruminantium TaxID=1917441 RepID=UPI0012DEF2C5|nr:transglutaminase domain-containing protein [Streptococcus ruminantium]
MNYHQNADRQRRYAIRKMRVCVGSVLVGFFLLTGNMATVQAAETSVVDSTMLAGNNSTADATPSTNDERRPAIENTSTESGETKDFLKEALPTSTENSNISTEESKSDSDAAEEKALPISIEESTKVSDNKVKETILNPIAHNYYDDGQYEISQKEVTIRKDQSVKLSLQPVGGGKAAEDVKWYVRTRYPYDKVYAHNEQVNGENNSQLLRLSADGTVTNLNNEEKTQTVELWAHYNQHLYRGLVTLPGKVGMEDIRQDEEANKAAEEIVKAFEGLSDVEKVKAAHDWLVDNVDYVARSGQDQSAYSALVEKKTVCAGYGHGLKLLLDKMGIPSQILVGPAGNERHLWNIVELDGKWYHVDATWDDAGFKDVKYTRKSEHLLIHDEDFELTRKTKRGFIKSNDMGEHYRYYGFEKHGVLARTLEDVQTILERQYHKAVPKRDSATIMEVMAPNKITSDEIQKKLSQITNFAKYAIHEEYYGGYTLHRFGVTLLPQKVETTVKVEQLQTEISTKNPRISNILVKLDKGVELNKANITVTGAKLTGIEKVNGTNKEYRLLLDEPERMTDAKVKVAIHKRDYQFTLADSEVPIHVKRADTPKAVFTATGENEGYLSNVAPGMEYRILRGTWKDITGDRVELKNIGLADIFVRVKGTDQAFASSVQRVKIKKTKDPYGVKAYSGQIVGVNKDMEYRRKGDTVWFWSSGNILKGLVDGEYEIRTRATGDHLASNIEVVNLTGGLQATQENIAKQQARAEQEAAARQTEAKRQVEAEKAKVQEQSKTEQDAKRKAEQDAKRKAEEKAAVEKAKAEQEAKRKAEEKAAIEKAKAEQDAKRKAEEKAAIEKAKAEQDAKRKTEEKAAIEKAKAEQDAKRKAEEKAAIEKAKAEQEAKRKAAETQNKEQEVARQVETNSQSEAQPQSPVASGVTTVQHQESTSQRSAVSQGQTGAQRAATTTHQAPAQSLTTEQTQNNPVTPKASEGEKANVEKKSEDKKATSKEQVASAQEVKKATEKKQNLALPLVLALSAIILGLFGYSKMQNKKED